VQATVALGTGASRWAKRVTPQVMAEVCGVPMGVGTLSPLAQATPAAGAAPVEDARPYVHEQAVAHLDETRWRQGAKRAWVWGAVPSRVTVWGGRLARGGQVARALVGEHFAGSLVPERSRASTWSPVRWRQLWWAHLLRDFAAMRARGGAAEAMGEAWLAPAHQRLTGWHRGREGTLQRSTFRSSMTPLRREGERVLSLGSRGGGPQTAGPCRDSLKRREALGTFVQVDGGEPTNNTAERALRPGVRWRKGSFGTQSAEGSRFVESLMTVVATVQHQQRHVLADLTAAHEAALRGDAAPSLLPESEQQAHAAA
jgi:transposase